jgi:hypothetical protein
MLGLWKPKIIKIYFATKCTKLNYNDLKCDLIDIQALAGGDKPPPLQANLYLKSSGGVYPRPYWVP